MHNLPWTCSWQQLKDAFVEAGVANIERADVIIDSSGRSRQAPAALASTSGVLAVQSCISKRTQDGHAYTCTAVPGSRCHPCAPPMAIQRTGHHEHLAHIQHTMSAIVTQCPLACAHARYMCSQQCIKLTQLM